MKRIPKISDAEWEVMKVLWNSTQATANDVVKALSGKTIWKRETIRTLINRLVQKKVLGFKKNGRQYYYYPKFSEKECVRAETKSFLDRVYGGSIEPMLAAFLEEEFLSPKKIAKLKRILDQDESVKGSK